MEKVRDFSEDEFGHFLTNELSQLTDVTLVLLKGHLFTEFAINCYLESLSQTKKSNFFKENFTYATKLKMLVHFGNFENEGTLILEATRIINKLRNGIAHSLNVNEQLIQEFFANLDKALPPNNGNFRNEKLDIPLRLTSGIAIICGIIFGRYLEIRDGKN
ncbi:hypothetical protein [Aequorivita xiaoshiensis]|uniref:Uncharacterized protein n=1 Tax=Aequorivita xiaoshiensis TaxID=2874476 RepID=A0A9X1R2V2_9FLAO|nr:hypothetical protein [Aequorivita xiaoshiensis]MCG2432125.1 hypothetical protein [Aequorivita xiaoshiensis]